MAAYRLEPFVQCHREMFGDLVLTCQTPLQGEPSRRTALLPVECAPRTVSRSESLWPLEVRRASEGSATQTSILESEKRRASALVDELLVDIYYSVHGGTTDYNSTSGKSHRSSWVEVVNLEEKETAELSSISACLTNYTERMGSVLVRQLKRRDALRRQQEAYCDVITTKLEERVPQGTSSEDMRFTIQPLPGDTGFSQWSAAMKMVAQLPGGIPSEFRSRLWLTLAERHLAAEGINWPEVERICFSEWSHPADAELGVQIVKDLHRTGCSLFCGEDGQENQALLKRVLLAYARWNKAVGYCQGFNMLAALILQVTEKCESDALKLMIYLVEGVLPDSYFADSLRGLSVDMAVFRELLRSRLPRLSKHLDTLQNAAKDGSRSYEPPLTNVFTMQWFLTLFCNCLPQPTVLRVWDLILLEGNEVLLRTALAIWQVLADKILAARSADEFYCIMGVLMRELLEFGLIDGNSLIKAVVAIGPLTELQTLREHYLYNINPWGAANLPQTVEKQLKLYPRHALALDISSLKKQYAKLKQRQRQAHIIFSAAISRQPPPAPPVTMNHLLIGKSALVPAKRLGPPKGSIPPARQVPSTLHWKDAPKQTSSSSSSDTELCDEDSAESSDEDSPKQLDNLPYDTDTDLMKNDNTRASMETPEQTEMKEESKESDDDNFEFEQFLADRVKCLKVEDPEERINCARRNSERALQIIQENSLILHRILQCQSRLSPSPPLQIASSSNSCGEVPVSKSITSTEVVDGYVCVVEDLKSPEYGSRYTSILEKSKSLDEKYNALILNKPVSKTAEELCRHVPEGREVVESSSPRDKSLNFLDQYRVVPDHNLKTSGNITKSYENLPVVLEETSTNTCVEYADAQDLSDDKTDPNTVSDFDFSEMRQSFSPQKFTFDETFTFCSEESPKYVSEYSKQINRESRATTQACVQDLSGSICAIPHDTHASDSSSDTRTCSDINERTTPTHGDYGFSSAGTDFRNYLFIANDDIIGEKTPDSPRHHQKEITPLRERVYSTFDELLNPEDKDSGVSSLTDVAKSKTDFGSKLHSQNLLAQINSSNSDSCNSGSFISEVYSKQSSKDYFDDPKTNSLLFHNETHAEVLVKDREFAQTSPNDSKIFCDVSVDSPASMESKSSIELRKPTELNIRVKETPLFKSPRKSPSKSPLKSPLKSPSSCFNPFPVPLSSRQSKEVPLKLGLYKK